MHSRRITYVLLKIASKIAQVLFRNEWNNSEPTPVYVIANEDVADDYEFRFQIMVQQGPQMKPWTGLNFTLVMFTALSTWNTTSLIMFSFWNGLLTAD